MKKRKIKYKHKFIEHPPKFNDWGYEGLIICETTEIKTKGGV